MASCFTTFEATELLENGNFIRYREEESKDRWLATRAAVSLGLEL